MRLIFLLIFIVNNIGCENFGAEKSSNNESNSYPDGKYCANVTYYNPNTQRQSEYILNVEVKNGMLVKILWSNGGWLDETHFNPPKISSNGDCSFISDKGYQYAVSVTGSECLITDNPKAIEGREGSISVRQCAEMYGASNELLNDYLKDMKYSPEDMIDDNQCKKIHEGLEIRERLRNLEKSIDEGYIQKRFSWTGGYGGGCQSIVVKRHGKFYVLEISNGEATMGLTSFNPNETDWQTIKIQEDPKQAKWVVVLAKVVASGSKSEMEEMSEIICR